MIREDISLARANISAAGKPGDLAAPDPIGDAPAEIEFEVDAPYDAGIVITIRSVPNSWGWQRDSGIDVVTPALQALAEELVEIMNSYNHNAKDVTRRFFGRIRVDSQTLVW